jgi:hypothetical protein
MSLSFGPEGVHCKQAYYFVAMANASPFSTSERDSTSGANTTHTHTHTHTHAVRVHVHGRSLSGHAHPPTHPPPPHSQTSALPRPPDAHTPPPAPNSPLTHGHPGLVHNVDVVQVGLSQELHGHAQGVARLDHHRGQAWGRVGPGAAVGVGVGVMVAPTGGRAAQEGEHGLGQGCIHARLVGHGGQVPHVRHAEVGHDGALCVHHGRAPQLVGHQGVQGVARGGRDGHGQDAPKGDGGLSRWWGCGLMGGLPATTTLRSAGASARSAGGGSRGGGSCWGSAPRARVSLDGGQEVAHGHGGDGCRQQRVLVDVLEDGGLGSRVGARGSETVGVGGGQEGGRKGGIREQGGGGGSTQRLSE